MTDINDLLSRAKAQWAAMTPKQQEEHHQAQRASWVRGELAMGSDRDEAAYREGMAARERNDVALACPYGAATTQYAHWMDGYYSR